MVVYYESIKRELKIKGIYECRCDERLQTKTKEFKRLTYTGLVLELEHQKIETRLIDEKFANAMGEYAHDQITLTELLKLQKIGQVPDETVRIHYVIYLMYLQ
jgi:hypothetical protein